VAFQLLAGQCFDTLAVAPLIERVTFGGFARPAVACTALESGAPRVQELMAG